MNGAKVEKGDNSSKRRFVKPRLFDHWHFNSILLAVYDLLAANLAYFLALWVRFDCRFTEIPAEYLNAWLSFAPIYAVVVGLVFHITKLYQSIWRFASFHEFSRVAQATAVTTVAHILLITWLFRRMPISLSPSLGLDFYHAFKSLPI